MPTDHWCAWFELVGQVASYQLRMVRYGYTTATEKSSKNLRSPLGGTEGALFQQLTSTLEPFWLKTLDISTYNLLPRDI